MNLSTHRNLYAIISALIISVFASAAQAETLQDYTFNVGPFKTLKVQDNVNVEYHCQASKAGTVTYKSTPEFDDAFILTNNNGTLVIQVNTEDVGQPGLPTIHVYSDKLAKVENYSDFNVTVTDPCESEQFSAFLIGNGTITINGLNTEKLCVRQTAGNGTINVNGTASRALFRMAGAGHIDAENLKVEDVNCKIFGGGTITCGPSNSLKSMGIGSTKIKYHGSPSIKHKGGGKLIPLDQLSNE